MPPRTVRRSDALSRQRIVQAAIGILDRGGESALTFKALTAALATGAGAVYHHVANKDELLAAATDEIVGAIADAPPDADPRASIRSVAAGVFDAIDDHPWVGSQLARSPWQTSLLAVFERIGAGLNALGVGADTEFDSASALLAYILGVAGQNAANARRGVDVDRARFLAGAAARWAALDPDRYPFVRRVAQQLADHDDREQFLAGVDLIVDGALGAAAGRQSRRRSSASEA